MIQRNDKYSTDCSTRWRIRSATSALTGMRCGKKFMANRGTDVNLILWTPLPQSTSRNPISPILEIAGCAGVLDFMRRAECLERVERCPSRLAENADRVEWCAANNILTVVHFAGVQRPDPDCCRPRTARLSLVPLTAATTQQPRLTSVSGVPHPQHDPPQDPQRARNGEGLTRRLTVAAPPSLNVNIPGTSERPECSPCTRRGSRISGRVTS